MRAALSAAALGALLLLGTRTSAAPTPQADITYLPVVLWHGMGDTCCGDSMNSVATAIRNALPGVYVKSIMIGEDESQDRRAGWLGSVSDHIDQACQQILDDPIIDAADGINIIGFSQGGQFARALVERCDGMWPYRLVTFGAQHSGVAEIPSCPPSNPSSACSLARSLLKLGAYLPFVQSSVVQAQYWRDPQDYLKYLEGNQFLPDVNNEKKVNDFYKEQIEGLDKLVMVMFEDDETVVPKESSWFGWYNETTGEPIPLAQLPTYEENWLGLRTLDEKGDLHALTCPGKHMNVPTDYLEDIVLTYFSEDAGALGGRLQARRAARTAARKAALRVQA